MQRRSATDRHEESATALRLLREARRGAILFGLPPDVPALLGPDRLNLPGDPRPHGTAQLARQVPVQASRIGRPPAPAHRRRMACAHRFYRNGRN